jgi:hypothetical protein
MNDQSLIHSASQTASLFKGPGREETILTKDLEDLKAYLMEEEVGRKLIALADLPDDFMNHTGAKLNPRYQVDQAFVDQYTVVYKQMADLSVTATVFDLRDQAFHIKEHRQFVYTLVDEKGKPYPNFDFRSKQVLGTGPNMTIELALLTPAGMGGNFLFNNRLGDAGFELTVEPGKADSYLFRFGDGASAKALSIPIPAGSLAYAAIVCGGGMTRAYVDGKLVGSVTGTPRASGSQMLVHEKWHPWGGRILEMKVSKRAKGAGEIAATAPAVAKLSYQP